MGEATNRTRLAASQQEDPAFRGAIGAKHF
jgi:hypothetical protein